MRFGLRIPPCAPPQDLVDLTLRAEAGGFDVAWIPDSQLLWRDVWVSLGVLGQATSTIHLGTNVTNPMTRHATVTASAAAAMDELAPGRFTLGIGTGDSSVRVMGQRGARIAELRAYVERCRELWSGAFVERDGARYRLTGATGRQVPVYVAASGPRMLETAGEIGDGVILLAGVSADTLTRSLERIDAGARRSGRSVADLDVATGLFCYVTDDRAAVLEQARPYAAVWGMRHRASLLEVGIAIPEPSGREDEVYPDLGHAEDWDRAIEVTAWVPDEVVELFADTYCVIGSGAEVADRIQRLASFGVTNLYVRGFRSYELPHDVCDAFVAHVIPRLRSNS